jgi:hypothetical protein
MDQPTAEEALGQLEPLVGEWTLEAKPPDGPPWPGEVAHDPAQGRRGGQGPKVLSRRDTTAK